MAFQEFYVTQGSSANAANGGYPLGSNDGPTYTTTVTVTNSTTLTDGAGPWTGVSVGDWLCVNDGATFNIAKITAINAAAATISPATTVTGSGRTVRVGGAFDKLSTAMTRMNNIAAASWPSSTNPPRINVKRHSGTSYAESTNCSNTAAWTKAIPLRIEGYDTTAGDINPWTSTNRSVLSVSANKFVTSQVYVSLVNIEVQGSGTTAVDFGNNSCTAINVKASTSSTAGSTYTFNSAGIYNSFLRCWGIRSGTPAGASYTCAYPQSGNCIFVGCIFEGPGASVDASTAYGVYSGGAACIYHSCVFHKCYTGLYFASNHNMAMNCDIINNKYGISGSDTFMGQAIILNCKIAHNSISGAVGIHSDTGSPAAVLLRTDLVEFLSNTTNILSGLTSNAVTTYTGSSTVVQDYANGLFYPSNNSQGNYTGGILLPNGEAGGPDIGAIQRPRRIGYVG